MGSCCCTPADELLYEGIAGDDQEARQVVDTWYEVFHEQFGEEVTKKQVLEIFNVFCPVRNNELIYDEIVRRYAGDQGRLDFVTFIKALCDSCRYDSEIASETFAMFDVNRDGELTKGEIEQIAVSHLFMKGNHDNYMAKGNQLAWDIFESLDVEETGKVTISRYHQLVPDDENTDDEKKNKLYKKVHFVDMHITALVAIANNVYHLLGNPVQICARHQGANA